MMRDDIDIYEREHDEFTAQIERDRDDEMQSMDIGEPEPQYKTCEYAKPIKDENGHFDEIMCCYKNNECNFCGVPCPKQ